MTNFDEGQIATIRHIRVIASSQLKLLRDVPGWFRLRTYLVQARDATGVASSNRRATVAQITEKVHAGSGRKGSEYMVYQFVAYGGAGVIVWSLFCWETLGPTIHNKNISSSYSLFPAAFFGLRISPNSTDLSPVEHLQNVLNK